jgi:hypothetical protein
MRHNDNLSEEIFARLCSNKYFAGFVYQNPKFTLGSECEAGDVVRLGAGFPDHIRSHLAKSEIWAGDQIFYQGHR